MSQVVDKLRARLEAATSKLQAGDLDSPTTEEVRADAVCPIFTTFSASGSFVLGLITVCDVVPDPVCIACTASMESVSLP